MQYLLEGIHNHRVGIKGNHGGVTQEMCLQWVEETSVVVFCFFGHEIEVQMIHLLPENRRK